MKLTLERIIIKNRAPFEEFDLSFRENEIAVLTAANGRGKTTILSYIVDAWYEIARNNFPQEFEGKESKFYRVSSSLYNLNTSESSFVYVRFKYGEEHIDYVDIRGGYTQEQYAGIALDDKIPFGEIKKSLDDNGWIKKTAKSLDKKKAENLFNSNVITYFPAYRFEVPGYINDPYKISLDFTKDMSYSGYLPNPIEVVTGLPQLANWIMDVVLDMELYKQTQDFKLPDGQTATLDITPERQIIWTNLNQIIKRTLTSKGIDDTLRFGIGKRNSGGTRISIMSDSVIEGRRVSKQVYPTIFNMSSGEAAMFCLFGEILRQSDKIGLNSAVGVVLIDEVDKHLHIKLQKEVLPSLFSLFPNVQFIVSSHSPFLNMGLAEHIGTKARATIVDLDQKGLKIPVYENSLYQEVYQMMVSENENYAKMCKELLSAQDKSILVVEDEHTQIYKIAWLKLNDIECEINDVDESFKKHSNFVIYGKGGHNNLQGFLNNPNMDEWRGKIVVGLFDFDDAYTTYLGLKSQNWDEVSSDDSAGMHKKRKNLDVYAMMLPIPDFRKSIAGKDQIVKQLEVELLLEDDKIKEAYCNDECAIDKIIEGILEIPKIQNKEDFWRKAFRLDKDAFGAFLPLFKQLANIFTQEQGE